MCRGSNVGSAETVGPETELVGMGTELVVVDSASAYEFGLWERRVAS